MLRFLNREQSSGVATLLDRLVVERESLSRVDSESVAVLAHFSTGAVVSRSFNALIQAFLEHGFRVVVVSAADVDGQLEFDEAVMDHITVLRKPNLGYDFGSWALGLNWDPSIKSRGLVVLANDSMVGPFASMDLIFDRVQESGADVVGMTETTQFVYHLQSYFVAYRRGVLADPVLSRFWMSVRHEPEKTRVIWQNEIGLSRLLWQEGYAMSAVFTARSVLPQGQNPTILSWRALLQLGFPFVKRELLRNPRVAPDAKAVPGAVRRQFGIDVGEWI